MKDAGGGAIVTMGWDQAETGMEGDSGELFAATKGAIMAFTRSLALSLAPNVRVNALAPGLDQDRLGRGRRPTAWHERVLRETPLAALGHARRRRPRRPVPGQTRRSASSPARSSASTAARSGRRSAAGCRRPVPRRTGTTMADRPRFLFVTGRLAEFALRQVLDDLAAEAGFTAEVAVLPISVAALMTPRGSPGISRSPTGSTG